MSMLQQCVENQKSSKKNILFVIPRVGLGGVTTSFISIYNELKDSYNIQLLTFYNEIKLSPEIEIITLFKPSFIDAFYRPISDKRVSAIYRLFVLFVKIIKFLCRWFKFNLQYICGNSLQKIIDNNGSKFDAIVAFQEGDITRLISSVSHHKKIAWIHCDYVRAFADVNEENLYDNYHKIVCVSNFTKNNFINKYPSLREKTLAIYNLYDSKLIIDLSSLAINLNFTEDNEFKIISIGRIVDVKRFSIIPHIAKLISDKYNAFKWYIIGPFTDIAEVDKIKQGLRMYDLEDKVLLLGAKENPYPYIKNSNLLVSLSSSEACPMIFLESRILGTPIVSTDFGSAYEFIENGITGFISSIENIHTIILQLMTNEELYNRVKSATYCDDFYQNNSIKKIISLFDNM